MPTTISQHETDFRCSHNEHQCPSDYRAEIKKIRGEDNRPVIFELTAHHGPPRTQLDTYHDGSDIGPSLPLICPVIEILLFHHVFRYHGDIYQHFLRRRLWVAVREAITK